MKPKNSQHFGNSYIILATLALAGAIYVGPAPRGLAHDNPCVIDYTNRCPDQSSPPACGAGDYGTCPTCPPGNGGPGSSGGSGSGGGGCPHCYGANSATGATGTLGGSSGSAGGGGFRVFGVNSAPRAAGPPF